MKERLRREYVDVHYWTWYLATIIRTRVAMLKAISRIPSRMPVSTPRSTARNNP